MKNLKTDKKKNTNEKSIKIKEAIFKMLPSIILALIIVAGILVIINIKPATDTDQVIEPYTFDGSEEPVVVDNGELKLTMDPKTTTFSLEVKDSGKVWYSNPEGATSDPLALEDTKAYLQ